MNLLINSPSWNYREGELYCEEVPLKRIARKVGTPVYVYSRRHLVEAYREIISAWRGRSHLVCFSMKSNSNRAVIRTLVGEGSGIDVVSGGELFRALRAGAPPEKIVFAGVGKTEREIIEGIEAGILFFTVESLPELELISRTADRLGKTAPVALRVTPDVDPKTHRYITTGKAENKFGLDREEALDFYRRCLKLPGIAPVGIHMHIGSQILQTAPFREGVDRLVGLLKKLKGEGISLKYLDIGGGMGISYQGEEPPPAAAYASALRPLLKGLRLTVILEPGRFITGNAGSLLTSVLQVKKKAKKSFVIADGAMNDLIRPALYEAWHQIVPVSPGKGKPRRFDVVGPICETGDILGAGRSFPEPAPGDLLAVLSAGAYGAVMGSNYNSRPRPPEVLVDGDTFRIVRKRETYRDLVRGELD
ncbi:MAG: diaminopimelate decarboxylase [Candidatus Erginobacter occultus]|nr:diaminopimelate decarboxylase [Candidatus Erginobacter occultus]